MFRRKVGQSLAEFWKEFDERLAKADEYYASPEYLAKREKELNRELDAYEGDLYDPEDENRICGSEESNQQNHD